MSSFYEETRHPQTGAWESALWMDDFFGPRRYGVKFQDGQVFDPRSKNLPTRISPPPSGAPSDEHTEQTSARS